MRRPYWMLAAVALAGCQISETPLQLAVKARDLATVKALLEAGADTHATSLREMSSARLLAFNGLDSSPDSPAVDVLRLMLSHEGSRLADERFSLNCRKTPCRSVSAVELAIRHWNPGAVSALIEAGLTPRSQGTTDALVYALADGNDEGARLLVEAGADLNGRASSGSGPMEGSSPLEAARNRTAGSPEMVPYLLSKGAL